ncbi:hypothetical protein ABZW51_31100, partial [Streptomyces cellulosae]
MLDYDEEAERYDALRGGEPRAAAAAEAVLSLVPRQARRLLDAACGTGIVTRRFPASRPGLRARHCSTIGLSVAGSPPFLPDGSSACRA